MKLNEFDRSFGDTPQVFSGRIDETLLTLKEDVPVKRFTIRTAILVTLILMLLCGIAYAIVVSQGQEWYYNNRFTALQEVEPLKHQAIMDNLQTEVPQEDSPDKGGAVTMTMQDYAWVKDQVFTLSMAARPTQPQMVELHPIMALDTDGSYGPTLEPDDPESRTEHWLWTEKGFGPPQDTMLDPSKKLMLLDFEPSGVMIGDTDVELPKASSDSFAGEDGASICVLEFDLRWLDDDFIRSKFQPEPSPKPYEDGEKIPTLTLTFDGYYEGEQPEEGTDPAVIEAVTRLQNGLSALGFYNGHINGVFDKEVQQCLMGFQKMNGLTADGIADPLTQQTLFQGGALDASGEAATMPTPPSQEQSAQEQAQRDEVCQQQLAHAKQCRDAIAQSTDANGNLTLRLSYSVVPFENGALGEAAQGSVVFQVQTK